MSNIGIQKILNYYHWVLGQYMLLIRSIPMLILALSVSCTAAPTVATKTDTPETVNPKEVSRIEINPSNWILTPNKKMEYVASLYDANGSVISDESLPITWSISNTDIAIVSGNGSIGIVTGKNIGDAMITAAVADKTATAAIKIIDKALQNYPVTQIPDCSARVDLNKEPTCTCGLNAGIIPIELTPSDEIYIDFLITHGCVY